MTEREKEIREELNRLGKERQEVHKQYVQLGIRRMLLACELQTIIFQTNPQLVDAEKWKRRQEQGSRS